MPHRRTKSTPPPPSPTEVSELAALKAQVAELTAGWQRSQADFENFRRRVLAEQADRTATEVGRVLLLLTPVAENLRRALGQLGGLQQPTVEQLAAWAEGIRPIARQLDQALSSAGLTPIHPTGGEAFDPTQHEALAHQPHPDHSHDTVTQVVERGYKVGQRVLIPAKVIVSSGPQERKV